MKVKSAKSFRTWFRNLNKAREKSPEYWNEDFMGVQHGDESGFFQMYHGEKSQVYDFLRKEVEMAEDGQAIYEFVQNAADSNGSHFYMFYDKDYLLVVNNGSVFSKEGIKSILNIGQSHGKHEPDKIGRYGIGFKLVHRLVGKSSGLDELLNTDKKGYRGPILFSWSERAQFTDFLKATDINYVDFEDNNAPWLLKILITNFPAQPEEHIKDIEYRAVQPFKIDEVRSFQAFLNSCMGKMDVNILNTGTIFFIKLGEAKFEYLEKQKTEYLNGLEKSMHFLKALNTLVVNDRTIKKDATATNVLEFTIKNGSDEFNKIGLTEIRDKESDAKFKICFADNAASAEEIKKHPNIYKYFPAVKEVNNLSFIIHSNLFELSSNRQNLTETPINKQLLSLLSRQIMAQMESDKINNRDRFKRLFTSVLMSDEPSSLSSGNGWQKEFFYKQLSNYIKNNIPTKGGKYANDVKNVKIKRLHIDLNLADFGLEHIQWFDWDEKDNTSLFREARNNEKLGIEPWYITDIIRNASIEKINTWLLLLCNNKMYTAFLNELEKQSSISEKDKKIISQIKLFKFSDNTYCSLNDIISSPDYNGKTSFKYNNCFFINKKLKGVKKELIKLGIVVSDVNIDDYKNIFSAISLPEDKKYFDIISNISKQNTLSASEKKKLFLNFIHNDTKFDYVGEETLKELCLFSNNNGEIQPLNKLIGDITLPNWLNKFKIKKEELFIELNTYLINTLNDIYEKIYKPNKGAINAQLTTAEEIKSLMNIFKENKQSFFKEFVIKQSANDFVIIDKTAKTYQVQVSDEKIGQFISKYYANILFTLPYEFIEYCKNEEGIVKGEDLHRLILEYIDINKYREILVDIVKYKAKYEFIQEIDEFIFDVEEAYTQDSYEYKILSMACSELNNNDYKKFRHKVVIATPQGNLEFDNIPLANDKIKIENYELSLSKILPNSYKNSSYLSKIVDKFTKLGLEKEALDKLFGISEKVDLKNIFNNFSAEFSLLENAEQLAFTLLYNEFEENIDLSKFEALCKGGGKYNLSYNFYTKSYDFLKADAALDDKYKGIDKILKDLPFIIENTNQILEAPYIRDGKFICPDLKEEFSEMEQLSLIEFLFKLWNENNAQIRNIDWSSIEDVKTEKLLGFNPRTSVYPNQYACKVEQLPSYIIKWIDNNQQRIAFFADLGVWIENSIIVELRKFFKGDIATFSKKLAQESRFNKEEINLFNTFKWLKENDIELTATEQYELFEKVVELINENRTSDDLVIEDEFDIESIENSSEEKVEEYYQQWKNENNISIYLYEGELPKIISLDEIDDFIFYRYNSGDYYVDDKVIYINSNKKEEEVLSKVASDENNDFTVDELFILTNSKRVQELIDSNHQKDERIKELEELLYGRRRDVIIQTSSSTDISQQSQKEANREAKEIVRERLESEGFIFTQGIGDYSTINGVIKNGIEFPLVVKSYKSQHEPFKIGANEWIQLMKPHSMFWVHFGNRNLGCLKLYELLRKLDKLSISFSTENLDVEGRLEKFAILLRYFSEVHFNFSPLLSENYRASHRLENYRFDERKNEIDLSEDDESDL